MFIKAYRWVACGSLAAIVTVIACSNSSGPGPGGKGLCVTSCPKTCSSDSDCPSGSQLCCDFGSAGKACTTPQDCGPARFCSDDSKCNTGSGETCCAANPRALDQKVCAPAAACKKSCANDNECAGTSTPKCCTLYDKPICTRTTDCPNPCTQSTECDTAANETCCNAPKVLYGDHVAGSVKGVCLAQGRTCPKACQQSSECDTARNELCCNGYCSTSCTKACESNNECDTTRGQLCCRSGVISSPWYGFRPMTPPPPCGTTTRCTRTADCMNGQICCGNPTGPVPTDGGMQNTTCSQTCLSFCRTSAQCQAPSVVCP